MKHQTTLIRELLKIPCSTLPKRIETEINRNPALERTFTLESKDGGFDESNYKWEEIHSDQSLQENLLMQLHTSSLGLELRQIKILQVLIGSLDENGYLRREAEKLLGDLKFKGLECTPRELEELIEVLQTFKPYGIATRNVQECLLIQMRIKSVRAPKKKKLAIACDILERSFNAFSNKHYDKICTRHKIDPKQLRTVIDEIVRLNPKPGAQHSIHRIGEEIVADLFFTDDFENVIVTVNPSSLPSLQISDSYKSMLNHFRKSANKSKRQKEALKFIHKRINEAQKFIDALKRRVDILQIVGEAVYAYQRAYFHTGDDAQLKSMKLDNLTKLTGFDIATISRAMHDKIVYTEYGYFPAKKLFSEGITTADGKVVSTAGVKKALIELIKAENKRKPYSDEKLQKMLKEQGFQVSRRTVLNYRKELSIPVARLRKKIIDDHKVPDDKIWVE